MRYSNAPIVEAIIDIQIAPVEGLETERLAELKPQFGIEVEQNELRIAEISITEDAAPIASSRLRGYRFVPTNKRSILQVRPDGFAFSLLPPYDSWEEFRERARPYWKTYRDFVHPKQVTRIALRYINHLEIPLSTFEIKDYLRTIPEISSDLPQSFAGYFMQLLLPQGDIGATAVLNQGILPPRISDTVSLLLDIDLFQEEDVPSIENEIWAVLEIFRLHKNEIFNACLTEKAKELIR